jgi:hypothetical protein
MLNTISKLGILYQENIYNSYHPIKCYMNVISLVEPLLTSKEPGNAACQIPHNMVMQFLNFWKKKTYKTFWFSLTKSAISRAEPVFDMSGILYITYCYMLIGYFVLDKNIQIFSCSDWTVNSADHELRQMLGTCLHYLGLHWLHG